jgi:hypothetical protein
MVHSQHHRRPIPPIRRTAPPYASVPTSARAALSTPASPPRGSRAPAPPPPRALHLVRSAAVPVCFASEGVFAGGRAPNDRAPQGALGARGNRGVSYRSGKDMQRHMQEPGRSGRAGRQATQSSECIVSTSTGVACLLRDRPYDPRHGAPHESSATTAPRHGVNGRGGRCTRRGCSSRSRSRRRVPARPTTRKRVSGMHAARRGCNRSSHPDR